MKQLEAECPILNVLSLYKQNFSEKTKFNIVYIDELALCPWLWNLTLPVWHFETDADDPRPLPSLITIIGALLVIMLGKTPSGIKQSVYEDQTAILNALLATFRRKPGMSKRNLEDKFARANEAVKNIMNDD